MKRLILILLSALAIQAQTVRLQVLTTTDTHGRLMPEDVYTLKPANHGWIRLATRIRKHKAENPNTLLVDCGDTTQGDPAAYVRTLHPDWPEPAMAIMNDLGYHAMVVGNHEFDFGMQVLRASEEQAKFPWLSANTLLVSTGKPAFTPYVIQEVAGVKVAILGLTTATVARSSAPSNWAGLTFLDPVEAAKVWVPKLKSVEKADVVIVALHSGGEAAPCSSRESSQAFCLAEQVPGIDLILAGHAHKSVSVRHNNVPILEADAYGRALGIAQLVLRKSWHRWSIESCETQVEPLAEDTPSDPKALELTAGLRAETTKYLDTFATNLGTDLDGRWSFMEDSALLQLIHAAQLRATGAQLSAACSPGSKIFIPKGPTSIRQFYALMPYEDRVVRIRITGAQLRLYLEHAARFFNYSHQPELFSREVRSADYDMVYGVSYALDLSKPVGNRVIRLRYRGDAVKDDQSFTMAVTSYRLVGGGGYMEAIGFKGKAEVESSATLRNTLLAYVLSRPSLTLPLANNWRIVPALDRERILAQQP